MAHHRHRERHCRERLGGRGDLAGPYGTITRGKTGARHDPGTLFSVAAETLRQIHLLATLFLPEHERRVWEKPLSSVT